MSDNSAFRQFFDALACAYRVLTVKTYRVQLPEMDGVPVLPCLDHEAVLAGKVPLHVSAYLQDPASGDLLEVAYYPSCQSLVIDRTSTIGEFSPASEVRLREFLEKSFPSCRIQIANPSWWRGEDRASNLVRAQIALREVLLGSDLDRTKAAIERVHALATLMEKESRATSWGVRTLTTPVLAAAGIVLYFLLDNLLSGLSQTWLTGLRYTVLTLVGGGLLYVGMKAVHLTEASNRVWKRAVEYGLILSEKKRKAVGAQNTQKER